MEKKSTKNKLRSCPRRTKICAAIGGLFLGFSWQWGRQLDTVGNVNFTAASTWVHALLLSAVAAILLAFCFLLLDAWTDRTEAKKTAERRTDAAANTAVQQTGAAASLSRFASFAAELSPASRWLLRALGLFLAWLPVFLAVYPGFFAYDATDELNEVLTGEYLTRHPLLHVLLLGKTVAGMERLTGSYNAGIALYVIVQMIVMALFLSWVLGALKQLGAGKALRSISFCFLAFFPVIPMYVLCTSKDMPFTAGMLGVLTLLCLLLKDREGFWQSHRNAVGLGVSLFAMAVFRNNGFYVFLLMIPVLLFLAGKNNRKKMALTAGLALLACLGINSGLKAALKPVDTGVQETFTVPIQQLARVWNYSPEIFTQEERETLFEILPQEVLERYNPKLSDMVKIDFNTENYLKSPVRYQKLWIKTVARSPFTCLNAWFMTSYGFWYPDTVIDVYNGSRLYENSSFFSFETEPPGVRQSRLPLLERLYRKISVRVWVQEIPIVALLFSVGFMGWLYIISALYLISSGRWKTVLALLPVYLNWLTVLLGPACLVRYVVIFWFALPLLITLVKPRANVLYCLG